MRAATRAARRVRPSGVPATGLDARQLTRTRLDEVRSAERIPWARLGGYVARAITRDHIVRVRAARDEHSSEHVRPRPVERVAEAEAVSVAARRPSPERVVAEGIVERVAEIPAPVRISEADSEAEVIGGAEAVVVVIVPVSIARCDPGAFDDVRDRVVLEMPCAGHPLHDVEQSGERIVSDRFVAQDAVVPVPVADELVVLERLCHPGGEHRARAVIVVHHKRIAIRSTPQLLPLPAANEVVVSRIEREQHAHAAIRIGVQDDEVSILCGLDVDARAVAGRKPVVIDLHRDRRRSLSEREQEGEHHTSIIYRVARAVLRATFQDSPRASRRAFRYGCWNSMIGRTSTVPCLAPGIRAATWTASFMSLALIR